MRNEECNCLNEPMDINLYEKVRFVGIDETNGRFGEVNIWQCQLCRRLWLHYFVEFESHSASGRYFMGLISQQTAESLSPDEAVEYLSDLDWHLYGGSYFYGKRGRSTNRINADC
jgi:hypothetical protein